MPNYKKYLDCEFGYMHDNKFVYLNYGGIHDVPNMQCRRCKKRLLRGHTFTEIEEGTLWVFGSECVQYVFGLGLGNNFQ